MTLHERALLEAIRQYVKVAHGEQMYGTVPHIHHLEDVCTLVIGIGHGLNYMLTALLHDVLEDTDVSKGQLEEVAPGAVVKAVALITDPVANNRRERKELFYERMRAALALDPRPIYVDMALVVKLADREANVKHCLVMGDVNRYNMYKKEYPVFRENLKEDDSKWNVWSTLDSLMGYGMYSHCGVAPQDREFIGHAVLMDDAFVECKGCGKELYVPTDPKKYDKAHSQGVRREKGGTKLACRECGHVVAYWLGGWKDA